jgi:hypothetical protein
MRLRRATDDSQVSTLQSSNQRDEWRLTLCVGESTIFLQSLDAVDLSFASPNMTDIVSTLHRTQIEEMRRT